ncbi:MAG TPA: hypothetical protein VNB29_11535 [Chthoniobacterales bacterium]|nr:hypothetical protein [Chthoniobacterales bacterium]
MRFSASLLIAAFAATIAGVALAFPFGGLSMLPAILALAIGVATGAVSFRQMPRETGPKAPLHPIEWFLIAVFAMASCRAFFWLLYVKDDSFHIASQNNLGDLPLHLDFIRYLASGVHFWPDSPIFAGEPLKYPIGADFFNSLLLDAGLPVERGLVWVGLGGAAFTAVALWRWGRGFALAAFLFGGGLTGFIVLRDPSLLGLSPLPDFQAEQEWKNLFLAVFVTQRGLLFALPAGLLLLDHWRARYLRGERGLLPTWAAVLLYATMPLYNVHAFLFLSAAVAGIFAFAPDASARWRSARFVAVSFLPATICAALVTGGFSAGGGMHVQLGWMQNETDNTVWKIAWFWLRNFGFYLVLWLALTVIAVVRGPRELRAIVLPASVMFLACCFYSFAPWPWDNTKIMLWSWLAVAPYLWSQFIAPLLLPLRAVVCVVLFWTGGVSLVAGLEGHHDYSIVKVDIVQNTAQAIKDLPPEARFACAPEFWHPLIMLGRKVAMGYEGHLWSHGLTYRGKNQDKVDAFRNLMMGGPGWEQDAEKLGVDYIYWGDAEDDIHRYSRSLTPWEGTLPVVAEGEDFKIYALPKR